jgi:hypothetical protein
MWNWRGFLPPWSLQDMVHIFCRFLIDPLLFSKLHSVSAEFMFRLLKKRLCKELWPLSSSQSLSSSLSSSLSQSFKRPLWLSLNSWQLHSFNNMLSSDNQWWCTTQQCEKLNISRVSWSLVHSYHFRAAPFSLSSVTAFKHFSSSFLRAAVDWWFCSWYFPVSISFRVDWTKSYDVRVLSHWSCKIKILKIH